MENNHLIDKIVNGLRATALELEELQLQLALGKADATDKFEEVKEALHSFIQNVSRTLKDVGSRTALLRAKLGELEVQFALGRAENKDAFAIRKKQIEEVIGEIEDLLDSNEISRELRLKWSGEMQKFKILLEILRLQFELGKMELKEHVEKGQTEFKRRIEKLKAEVSVKEHSTEKAFETFWEEAKDAYHDLKVAFTK